MIEIPSNTRQLQVLMRRPEIGGPLSFVAQPEQDPHKSLSLSPKDMNEQVARMAKLAARFPMGALAGPIRAQYRRLLLPETASILRAYARAGTACSGLIKSDPAALLMQSRKLARYTFLEHRTSRWVNAWFDMRLTFGALQMFMLSQVTRVVTGMLEDPRCTPAQREKLETKFGKLLLHKELLLADQQDQRQLLAQRRRELEAQAMEVDNRTLVANVKAAIRQGQPVDQATLKRAGRLNAAQRAADAAKAAAQPVAPATNAQDQALKDRGQRTRRHRSGAQDGDRAPLGRAGPLGVQPIRQRPRAAAPVEDHQQPVLQHQPIQVALLAQ